MRATRQPWIVWIPTIDSNTCSHTFNPDVRA
jgi:hypothetical protein